MSASWILATDIDFTLTGDRAALDALRQELTAQRANGRLRLILSTGRRLDQVLEGLDSEGLPQADAIVTQVGTEIYLPPFDAAMPPLPAWDDALRAQFDRDTAVSFLQDVAGLEMQTDIYNSPLKVSAFLHNTPDPDAAARQIVDRIKAAGVDGRYQVVWSSGKHLDIIPAAAGKGKAIRFLLQLWQTDDPVVVAGDSGNDRSMFIELGRGVIVGNAQPELKRLRDEDHPAADFYQAEGEYAAGVAEGLRHFQMLDDASPPA